MYLPDEVLDTLTFSGLPRIIQSKQNDRCLSITYHNCDKSMDGLTGGKKVYKSDFNKFYVDSCTH